MITQVLIDSLIRASELALLAVGLTMIYDVLRFPSFAHVEFGTTGAFIAVAVSTALPLGPVPAILIGAIVAMLIGASFAMPFRAKTLSATSSWRSSV